MKKLILLACFVLAFSNSALSQNIVISDNLTTTEDISASNIIINNSKILDLATNNNSVFASTVNIDSDAFLIVGLGTILSSIRGVSDNVGNVRFDANNELLANVGTATTSLSELEISSGATLIMGTRNIDANQIILNEDAVLNYGSGTIIGEVNGESKGLGKFVFNNTKTTSFSIGQNNLLGNIDVANGATVTLGGNIAAKDINIGSGVSGKIRSNGKNISSENINLGNGATLEIDAQSVIVGEINGAGVLQFSGSNPINWQSSIGEKNKLTEVLISNEATINLDNEAVFNAHNITIGEGSSGEVGTPILNQNSGILGIDNSSLVRLNTEAVFNYNGGIINGIIRGTSSNKGTFNINHNYVSNSAIGQSFSLANLNVAEGVALTANSNISANNINVAGSLHLGNSPKTINGNLATSSGATIDLGSANHIINGNFSAVSQDILKITALNNLNIGSLSVSGDAYISSDTNLQISFNYNDGYLSDDAKIRIISGASGLINSISDNNINVNNSGSNKLGIFTFRTENSQNELLLVIDKKDVNNFTSNKVAQNIYFAVDKVGAAAQGEIRELQKLIDSDLTSDETRDLALKSIIPQSNDEINNSAVNSILSAVNVVNSRLDNIMLGVSSNQDFDNYFAKNNFRKFGNFNFEDEVFDNQSIWIQAFSSSATKNDQNDASGYNYESGGIAVGVDQEVSANLRLGISASVSEANVSSIGENRKQTNINSYQFNLYSGYVFDPYFISAIVGVALNKYSAIRSMSDMNLNAKADYGGQSYVVKIESGVNKKFTSGFFVIPRLTLTAAKNQVATYSENGAGTLNLTVSNEHSNFLETKIGMDFGYDDLKIDEFNFRPKIKISYGYNLLSQGQSSKNNFSNQNDAFVIKSPDEDPESLKYGVGFDLYDKDLFLVNFEYGVEKRKNYQSKNSSICLKYKF